MVLDFSLICPPRVHVRCTSSYVPRLIRRRLFGRRREILIDERKKKKKKKERGRIAIQTRLTARRVARNGTRFLAQIREFFNER